jgi:hypothetical protein
MLNVPRPERGYWAKLAVGKASTIPALPDARPGDETHWTPGGGVTYVEPQSQTEQRPAPSKTASIRRFKTHPLVVGAKPLFEAGTTARDSEYLKPAKKLLVDLVVTRECLDKALGLANEPFCALEAAGHHVVIAPHSEHFQRPEVDEREAPPRRNDGYRFDRPWRPFRITAVYIRTLAIGLTIMELSENVEVRYVNGTYVRESDYVAPKRSSRFHDATWTTRRDFPTHRLCVQAFSPYSRAAWSKQWREERQGRRIDAPTIVADLEAAVPEIRRLLEEGKQRTEIEHQRWQAQMAEWKRQEEERRIAKARKDSIDELLAIIGDWAGVALGIILRRCCGASGRAAGRRTDADGRAPAPCARVARVNRYAPALSLMEASRRKMRQKGLTP